MTEKFSYKLVELLRDKKMVRRDLSKLIKEPKNVVDSWCDDNALPNSYQLKLISEALNVDYHELNGHIVENKSQIVEIYPNYETKKKPVKVEKAGEKKKESKIKNKSIMQHDITRPEKKHCRNCGIEKGTERMCHAESTIIKMMVGGSTMGGKIDDNLTALLCFECDQILSKKPDKNDYLANLEHAVEWFKAVVKTHLIS